MNMRSMASIASWLGQLNCPLFDPIQWNLYKWGLYKWGTSISGVSINGEPL